MHRGHHHVGDAVRDLVVGVDHRRGQLRIHHAARRRGNGDRAPAAGVRGYQTFRIGNHLQCAEHARRGDGQRRVHRTGNRGIGAREIGGDRVAAFVDTQLNGEGFIGGLAGGDDAVTVEDVGEFGGAVGQRAQGGAHHALGVILHRLHDVQQFGGAVFLGEFRQARAGAPVGGDLGAQVAQAFGGSADVGEDDRLDTRVGLSPAVEPHGRQTQALAEYFGDGTIAAGRGAADVGPVGAHAAEAEQRAAVEGGGDDVDVGQVRAAVIRVVVDEHVAGRGVRKGVHDGADGVGHRAEVDRQVGALRDHVARGVEDAAGVVAGDFQQGGIRGFGEDDFHFLGGAGQGVLDDFEAGRVDFQVGHGRSKVGCGSAASLLPLPFEGGGWGGLVGQPASVRSLHRPLPPTLVRSSRPKPTEGRGRSK